MKKRPRYLLFLMVCGAAIFACRAGAQKPAAQQQSITVTVVNVLGEPPQPVKAADVSLWFQDVEYQQRPTNTQGEALLGVSRDIAQRGDLRSEVTNG